MRKTGNYTRASTRQYERAWMRAYGHDFIYVRTHMSCMSLPCGAWGLGLWMNPKPKSRMRAYGHDFTNVRTHMTCHCLLKHGQGTAVGMMQADSWASA